VKLGALSPSWGGGSEDGCCGDEAWPQATRTTISKTAPATCAAGRRLLRFILPSKGFDACSPFFEDGLSHPLYQASNTPWFLSAERSSRNSVTSFCSLATSSLSATTPRRSVGASNGGFAVRGRPNIIRAQTTATMTAQASAGTRPTKVRKGRPPILRRVRVAHLRHAETPTRSSEEVVQAETRRVMCALGVERHGPL
jgi:hypothetical protein